MVLSECRECEARAWYYVVARATVGNIDFRRDYPASADVNAVIEQAKSLLQEGIDIVCHRFVEYTSAGMREEPRRDQCTIAELERLATLPNKGIPKRFYPHPINHYL